VSLCQYSTPYLAALLIYDVTLCRCVSIAHPT